MSDFHIRRLTEVCRLCELPPGRSESFQTAFSPGKDKVPVTEEQKEGFCERMFHFWKNSACIWMKTAACYPPEEFFDGGVAVGGRVQLLQE